MDKEASAGKRGLYDDFGFFFIQIGWIGACDL